MGCDIHIHAEIKIAGRWEHYAQPKMERNYRAFEKLAGVRGEKTNAMFPVRGMPWDASATTRFDCAHYGTDGHTHSWISADEIARFSGWWKSHVDSKPWPEWDCWLFGNNYSDFVNYPQNRIEGLEDIRFIFWFDN